MDRYGEIYTTYQKIIDGVALAPGNVIANGDAPIFHSKKLTESDSLLRFFKNKRKKDIKAKPNTDGVLCPNCQHILHYRYLTYSNLGKYFCFPTVVLNVPELKFAVTQIADLPHPLVLNSEVDGHAMKIEIVGLYNIYIFSSLRSWSFSRRHTRTN